jgi:hypothetical protein
MVLSARSVKFLGDLHRIHDGMGQLSQNISKISRLISKYLKVSQTYLKLSQTISKHLKTISKHLKLSRNFSNFLISGIMSTYLQLYQNTSSSRAVQLQSIPISTLCSCSRGPGRQVAKPIFFFLIGHI